MRLRGARLLHGLDLALLRVAWLLAPGRLREEWWREWRAELWHVRAACAPEGRVSWAGEREVAAFCLGAFRDAGCLLLDQRAGRVPLATTAGSARQCIMFLAVLAALSYGAGLLTPGRQLEPSPYRDARNLMLVHDAQYVDDRVPTVEADQFSAWKRRRQGIFDEFAFYRVARERVSGGGHAPGSWAIARGSLNLLQLLDLPVRYAPPQGEARGLTRVVLSDALWAQEFGRDPHIAGRTVRIGETEATVAGVMQGKLWRLPGKADAWLLEPDAAFAPGSVGFVVAHLKPTAEHARWGERWRMTAPGADGAAADFSCVSLIERTRGPWGVFWFTVFLACLALPATTSLPLGEYRVSSRPLSWSTRLRRWSFLACKIALLLPIVYFVSHDLACLRASFDPATCEYIQIVSSFSVCLFGLRWTLRDQRQRCPVCLGKLTHPARVGEPSRNFLGWNGMELICVGGHGLLHVPEIQTSWFSTQRWLYLDPSWEVLFAEPGLASAGFL